MSNETEVELVIERSIGIEDVDEQVNDDYGETVYPVDTSMFESTIKHFFGKQLIIHLMNVNEVSRVKVNRAFIDFEVWIHQIVFVKDDLGLKYSIEIEVVNYCAERFELKYEISQVGQQIKQLDNVWKFEKAIVEAEENDFLTEDSK